VHGGASGSGGTAATGAGVGAAARSLQQAWGDAAGFPELLLSLKQFIIMMKCKDIHNQQHKQ